jgi:hypothetical protein
MPFVLRAGLPSHIPTRGAGAFAPLPRATELVFLRKTDAVPYLIFFNYINFFNYIFNPQLSTLNFQLKKRAAGIQQMIIEKKN